MIWLAKNRTIVDLWAIYDYFGMLYIQNNRIFCFLSPLFFVNLLKALCYVVNHIYLFYEL